MFRGKKSNSFDQSTTRNRSVNTHACLRSLIKRFSQSTDGNMGIITAVMLGAVLVVIAGTLELSGTTSQHRELQSVADAAALASAREMAISSADQTRVNAIATSYVDANWTGNPAKTDAILDKDEGTITVNIVASTTSTSILKNSADSKLLSATAVAEVSGGGNVCIISLSKHEPHTIDLMGKSRITAQNCQVYSNSDHIKSFKVKENAQVKMDFVCIVGGLDGDPATLGGTVLTDCPAISDPLRDRPEPKYDPENCLDGPVNVKPAKGDPKTVFVNNATGNTTLSPGVYCDGLSIQDVTATLHPGIYVINGGELKVDKKGTLIGDGVGFLLVNGAKISFKKDSSIELHAPRDGEMAGLLFFERLDPEAQKDKVAKGVDKSEAEIKSEKHNIQSNDARVMVGTIYMPYGDFLIDGDNPISDQSEYTVIVAHSFQLENGPNLVIRTDYHLSDVPLPQGVGAQDVKIRLKR